jgi:2-polyprenyl-3-methyl-5-hydroxy-6-metoxy-1,4-benzoquinol methylase
MNNKPYQNPRRSAGQSQPPAYFERLYQNNPDPWNFAGSDYERRKYDATLAVLGARRFQSGLEAGCSIGVLTERLAARCDALLAIDIVASAIKAARARCAAHPHVRIEPMLVPRQWPEEQFDLIVFSEVLYFLAEPDLHLIAAHAKRCIMPGGVVLLVNYTGQTDDPCTGDEAANKFIAATGPVLRVAVQNRAPRYRLDLLQA